MTGGQPVEDGADLRPVVRHPRVRQLGEHPAQRPGGGMRTEELIRPGYRHDVCSTVQPMAAASPFFREFDPVSRGVRLLHPEICFAHPLDGGGAAVSLRSLEETAARLEKLRWWDWPEAQVRRAIPLLQAGDLDALEKLV